ncbi:hypothetical protein [Mycoplasmopsis gallinacea]|uniref:Uncharacterized protein n=1 Tax=Mycoplasmopsis gallinacea TaxID=29556 RepID=A0A6H0V6K6_9BACT|nr:hypothetical protein [Mycoplasmopsis gallinacea]QIW62135.1 hypothetical protein GOQ20_01610 [Mycoplasmopsis gallinacea]
MLRLNLKFFGIPTLIFGLLEVIFGIIFLTQLPNPNPLFLLLAIMVFIFKIIILFILIFTFYQRNVQNLTLFLLSLIVVPILGSIYGMFFIPYLLYISRNDK